MEAVGAERELAVEEAGRVELGGGLVGAEGVAATGRVVAEGAVATDGVVPGGEGTKGGKDGAFGSSARGGG